MFKKRVPLTNLDVIQACGDLPGWRGVFMRNGLPRLPQPSECGVLNLDDKDQPGTHWTCWMVTPLKVNYFDSYGMPPPRDFINYIRRYNSSPTNFPIEYNTFKIQKKNDGPICGHLCIFMLKRLTERHQFLDILLELSK